MKFILLALAITFLASNKFCGASIVTVAGSRAGPLVVTSSGTPVDGGLVRVGMLTAPPASSSVSDISAVFQEFETFQTGLNGRLGQTVSRGDLSASSFNGQVIHLWVFDSSTPASSTEHALFTNPNAAPADGDPWIFPIHTGTGTDSVFANTTTLPTDGDASYTPGVQFQALPPQIVLTQIPEPSCLVLLAAAAVTGVVRRLR